MAENNTPQGEGTTGTTQTAAAAPSGQERTFTQDEVNRMVGDARTKERSKYAGYDDYKAKAGQLDAVTAELEAVRAERDAAIAERDGLAAEKERAALVARVAAAQGVPAEVVSMLSAPDEEGLSAQAAALRAGMPAYPPVVDQGGAKAPTATLEDFETLRTDRERLRFIADHPDLF